MTRYFLSLTVIVSLFFGCESEKNVKIIDKGLIDCFECGLKNEVYNEIIYCETSAVVFYNNQLLFATDKPIHGYSTIFKTDFVSNKIAKKTEFIINELFPNTNKIEDFTITSDDKLVFATTTFDRYLESKPEWDAYNRLLYWKPGNEDDVDIVSLANRVLTAHTPHIKA